MAILVGYELLIWVNAELDLKYIFTPHGLYDIDNCVMERARLRINSLSVAMWLNLVLAAVLFVCLWRRKGDRTCHSSINVIPYGKIEYPFTFDKTYCRIGVITDNSGIKRMEAYFVRNDKTAICYKNSTFSHVVIDDTRYDKSVHCEISTGMIVGIRTTEGMSNHIVRLSDGRLIAFVVHPRGYGELYENYELCTQNDDGYADYLAEYEQGTDVEL